MTPGVCIRPEQPADYARIAEVVAAAFESPVQARLVEAIRASEQAIPALALVAEIHGAVVGHVMISHATLREGASERPVHNLSPLAVDPAQQGRGIGSALVREATARADALGAPLVVLEGDPRCYGRFGFERADHLGIHIPLPSWASPAAGQVLRLDGYDASLRGQVVYPPAFDAVASE